MSAISMDATALPSKAKMDPVIDLEKVPVDRVLAELAVKPSQGLSSAEAQQRLAKYGPNALVEKEVSLLRKILGPFTGPIAYMIEAAAIVSAVCPNRPPRRLSLRRAGIRLSAPPDRWRRNHRRQALGRRAQ